MGIPHSVIQNNNSASQKRPTKVTLFFSVEEVKALNTRFRQLVPQNHVVFEENFLAYCMWSSMTKTPETAKVFFRAFDAQSRGYFDFEDFCMTTGALTRGNSEQLAEVLLRMITNPESNPRNDGSSSGSPYRQPSDNRIVKYQDVVECVQALDSTFLFLRCDGGVSAQSVAARLPFDERGNLSFADLNKKVKDKMI